VMGDGCDKKVYGIGFQTELRPPAPPLPLFHIGWVLAHGCVIGGGLAIVKDLKFSEGNI